MKLLFYLFCIPVRFFLIYIFYKKIIPPSYQPLIGMILISISLSWIYLYFTKTRLNAVEGGGITWWHELRLIHAALYMCAGIYALQSNYLAYIPLSLDLKLGIVFHILNNMNYII